MAVAKGISMAGHTHVESPDHSHVNDYLKTNGATPPQEVNRIYARNSGASWIKLWTSWDHMQSAGEQSSDFGTVCNFLNNKTFPGTSVRMINQLDEQVRAAKLDGKGVILTLANTAGWATTGNDTRRPPLDRTTNGPWAKWLAYLMMRYTGTFNAVGPNPNQWHGNPSSARVDYIEICNEPNIKPPSTDSGNQPCEISEMIRTADATYAFWANVAPPPGLAAPATDDFPNQYPAQDFVRTMLDTLKNAGWTRSAAPWIFTHHNYRDLQLVGTSRLELVRNVLADPQYPWSGRNKDIYITEGGWEADGNTSIHSALTPAQEADHANRISAVYRALAAAKFASSPAVRLWTNHMLNDHPCSGWQLGLFRDWQYSSPHCEPFSGGMQGAIKPAGTTFQNM
jgi:hypothetical protein